MSPILCINTWRNWEDSLASILCWHSHLAGQCRDLRKGVSLICSESKSEEIVAIGTNPKDHLTEIRANQKKTGKSEQIGWPVLATPDRALTLTLHRPFLKGTSRIKRPCFRHPLSWWYGRFATRFARIRFSRTNSSEQFAIETPIL